MNKLILAVTAGIMAISTPQVVDKGLEVIASAQAEEKAPISEAEFERLMKYDTVRRVIPKTPINVGQNLAICDHVVKFNMMKKMLIRAIYVPKPNDIKSLFLSDLNIQIPPSPRRNGNIGQSFQTPSKIPRLLRIKRKPVTRQRTASAENLLVLFSICRRYRREKEKLQISNYFAV